MSEFPDRDAHWRKLSVRLLTEPLIGEIECQITYRVDVRHFLIMGGILNVRYFLIIGGNWVLEIPYQVAHWRK